MKIAIDAAIGLSSFEKGGIYYLLPYFLNTLSTLDKKNQYVIFGYFFKNYQKKIQNIKIPQESNFSLKTLRLPGGLLRNIEQNLHLPLLEYFLKNEKISVYHGISGSRLPYFKKIKTVYTVHDLSFETHPQWYKEKWYKDIRLSAERADIIISPSYLTKKDLINIYHIPENKIKVVYWGIDTDIFYPVNKEKIQRKIIDYSLPERFILTIVTSSIQRKNTHNLLNAYKILTQNGVKETLVIVTGTDYLKEIIMEVAKEKHLEENIICYSEIPKTDLTIFYSLAEVFVFPSLYEGFGLPVLEAMTCGCPVITSNTSCLPEIVDNAAILVDPYNAEEIANAMKKVLSDENLRQQMRKKGLERSKMFSWEKTARETLQVYYQAANI
jgi:glycosyltransferase involved in cell wall biosynthesis